MTRNEAAVRLAEEVSLAGGRAYYVGGYVRDYVLGLRSPDIDIEIHGLAAERLMPVLQGIGRVKTEGLDYGIFLLEDWDIDIALPRKETCTGKGHRDFLVEVDPYLSFADSSRRRDFTLNAMLLDVLSEELIDPFGGRADLESAVLRHIDPVSFAEDPLRLLRACQFAARFGFEIAPETMDICRRMDISSLPGARVGAEMKKALLKAARPSVFFECLRQAGRLSPWFTELEELIGLEQDSLRHPEGDVWTHTMLCLDRAAALRHDSPDPFRFMLLALTHDLGKINTTEYVKGKIHAYGHEKTGTEFARELLWRIGAGKDVLRYLDNMIPLHMKPNILAENSSSLKSSNRMFDEAAEPMDLILFAAVDSSPQTDVEGNRAFLLERLSLYREIMSRPYISGNDLIKEGLNPGEHFRELLEYSHRLRLSGVDRESALKQTLAMARKLSRSGQI